MSCTCNTANPNCEPCAFCTPPGVTCLPDCNPKDPCEEKIDLCCVLHSGEDQLCSDITNGEKLCDLLLKFLAIGFQQNGCCYLRFSLDTLQVGNLITLNDSGGDPGPYNLILLDQFDNVVPGGGTGITKSNLTSGYQLTIPFNVVRIKVESTSAICNGFDNYIKV